MENYRILIRNKNEFDSVKKFLIDNGIGGRYIFIGNSLTDWEKFSSVEYDDDYKEFSVDVYTQEMIDGYLSLNNDVDGYTEYINPFLWNKKDEIVGITTSWDLSHGDVDKNVKPITPEIFFENYE
jgi:hypothetical protein